MSPYYQLYLGLIVLALILSAIALGRKVRPVIFILLVLGATLFDEAYSTIAYARHQDFSWIYHLFCPIEYALLCLYYISVSPGGFLKVFARYSIPVFVTFSLCVSYYHYHFTNMPAININAEGLLLFVFYTHLLFTLDLPARMPLWRHGDFWMAVGTLVFYGGVFVFLGLYPYLFHLNFGETMRLFDLITKPLNITFYICIIIGLICSIRNNRYSIL